MDIEKNKLAIYSKNDLDLAQHINKLESKLKEITPENRIVINNSMYVGGFSNLGFDQYGVEGIAYIKFFEKINEDVKKSENELYLIEEIGKTLFGKEKTKKIKLKEDNLVEHEGNYYDLVWKIKDNSYKHRIIKKDYSDKLIFNDFPIDLKSKILDEENTMVSNEFILNLFLPLHKPLVELYGQFMNF